MNFQDFGTIASMLGVDVRLRESRLARVAIGLEPREGQCGDAPLWQPRAAYKTTEAPQPPVRQATPPPNPGVTFGAILIVFLILMASIFFSGFISAGVLTGLFGIPYAAFVLVYPAVVTLSSFLRAIPPLVTISRAKTDRAALMFGAIIGALLVLPATYFLAKWGVEAFGLLLPSSARDASYIAWNVDMAVDMRSVPDWMKEVTPYVSFGAAIIGLFAGARAKNKADRSGG